MAGEFSDKGFTIFNSTKRSEASKDKLALLGASASEIKGDQNEQSNPNIFERHLSKKES